MKIAIILGIVASFAVMQINASDGRPVVWRFRDQDGEPRMGIVSDSVFKTMYPNDDSYDASLESKENANAYLHEYSRRAGPHEESDSVQDMYNISDEQKTQYDRHHVNSNERDAQLPQETNRVYTKHIYAHDYSDSNSHSEESKSHSEESNCESEEQKPKPRPKPTPAPCDHESSEEKESEESTPKPQCKKCGKKMVYVYKQPPIVVHPKPTNVYIKSKPILVQPPPLVVHQSAPKPCNPVIKYSPPQVNVKPVIVKIKKAKTTTTTTTPCPVTTKKPCRKCRRKPSRKCNRCQQKKSKDYGVYYNNYEGVLT